MPGWDVAYKSGARFENEVENILKQYTSHIWRNVRLETLYTASGFTEVDLLCCYKCFIFVIEAKKVSKLCGEYDDNYWTFFGEKDQEGSASYSKLNPILQNNIHMRSLKDLYYQYYHEWLNVVPVVVVPNSCMVSADISDSVFTLSQLDTLIASACSYEEDLSLFRKFSSLVIESGCSVVRPVR